MIYNMFPLSNIELILIFLIITIVLALLLFIIAILSYALTGLIYNFFHKSEIQRNYIS